MARRESWSGTAVRYGVPDDSACQHADRAAWRCDDCSITLDALAPAAYGSHAWRCACGLLARSPRRDACVVTVRLTTRQRMSARLAVRERRRAVAGLSPFVVRFDALATVGAASAHHRRTALRTGR